MPCSSIALVTRGIKGALCEDSREEKTKPKIRSVSSSNHPLLGGEGSRPLALRKSCSVTIIFQQPTNHTHPIACFAQEGEEEKEEPTKSASHPTDTSPLFK